jgi:hypothetical protein
LCGLGLAVLLGAMICPPAYVSAADGTPPHVTVFMKSYQDEYNTSMTDFLDREFGNANSPAFDLVAYNVVTTTLTAGALAGSTALIIDESADMSLTGTEAAVIHNFVRQGGKVGLFAYPRFYWEQVGPNPGAYLGIADIFGNAAIGEPNQAEQASGKSAATVNEVEDASGIAFSYPYSVTEQSVESYDQLPFSPITSTGTKPVLVSTALGGQPVAVASQQGLLATVSIGDLVQGADANPTYAQFVVDAIVWLANSGKTMPYKIYLPLLPR